MVHDPVGAAEEGGHNGGLIAVPVAVRLDDEVSGGAKLGGFDGECFVFDDGLDGGEAGLLIVADGAGIRVAQGTQEREADEQDGDGRGQAPGPYQRLPTYPTQISFPGPQGEIEC